MYNVLNKLFLFFFVYYLFKLRCYGVNEVMKNYIMMYLNIE